MSISPVGAGERLDRDEPLVQLEEAQQIDEVAFEEPPAAQVIELVLAEPQAAKRAHLVADLVDIRREIDALAAALEPVLDLRAREMMQDDLHHRELVEVGVEQRLDDHAGPARDTGVPRWRKGRRMLPVRAGRGHVGRSPLARRRRGARPSSTIRMRLASQIASTVHAAAIQPTTP